MTRAAHLVVALAITVPTTARADDDESPPLSVYGFARLDVLADDRPLSDIARPMYVPMEGTGSEMTMTPRLSQLGLSIDKWELSRHVDGEGKLEIDFAGGSGVNAIRLRHAYGSVTYREHVEVLAGQTWDLVSPLYPSVQSDTLLLGAGNIGDRRPQLRMTAFTDHVRVAVAGAVTGTFDGTTDPTTTASMTTATKPMFQWLGEVRGPNHGDMTARAGISGHAAREPGPDGAMRASSSVAGHVFVPIGRVGAIYGELYGGYNAADIGGGLGQGVSPMTNHGVHSIGGWLETALISPRPRFTIAIGGAADVARGSDLAAGERQSNSVVYGSLRYSPKPTIRLGIEYLAWRTNYKDIGLAGANRVDFHTTVFF